MRTPEDVRSVLRTRYRRSEVQWLALLPTCGADRILVSLPLDPPTARIARDEPQRVGTWIRQWHQAEADTRWTLTWEERRWSGLGVQLVPVRIEVRGAPAVAGLAGEDSDWLLLCRRLDAVLDRWRASAGDGVDGGAQREVFARALGSVVGAVRTCEPEDFDRGLRVADWVFGHPDSGLLLRQVPVEGMDTKWLERHRKLVSALVAGMREAAGAEGAGALGLRRELDTRDVVVLDPALRPGRGPGGVPAGLRHFRADTLELARIWAPPRSPRVLLVCENRQSIVALPDMPGVVAVHGGGYAVSELHHLVWARDLPVLYWGDLDADGFAILNSLRHHHDRVVSVLMDRDTLEGHLALAVPGPPSSEVVLDRLDDGEREVVAHLHALGDLRLEQERLAWSWVAEHLSSALRAVVKD